MLFTSTLDPCRLFRDPFWLTCWFVLVFGFAPWFRLVRSSSGLRWSNCVRTLCPMNTADKWSQFNALPSWERKGVDEMAIKVGHTLHAGSSAEQIAWAIGYYKGVRPLSGWPA